MQSLDLKPKLTDMVALPFQKNVFLYEETLTRWTYDKGELYRDLEGEKEWETMASYVGKIYRDVFMDSYHYALNNQQ